MIKNNTKYYEKKMNKQLREFKNLKMCLNYLAHYFLLSLILPNYVFCHKHHCLIHVTHRKRSDLQESSTLLPSGKEHLKEALELLNLGKKTLGLRTEDPEVLMELVQNTNDDAKSSHIQRILQEPQMTNQQNVGNQYLVLTGENGKLHVDNFTSVTLSPQEEVADSKGNNLQEVFKMEMEKNAPHGKENVFHKVTVIETNKQLPSYFSPKEPSSEGRQKRHKRRRTYRKLRDRQKRDNGENSYSMFTQKSVLKNMNEDEIVFKDGEHKSSNPFIGNNIIDLEKQTSNIKPENNETSRTIFQHSLFKGKDVYYDDIKPVETHKIDEFGRSLQRFKDKTQDGPNYEFVDKSKIVRQRDVGNPFSAFRHSDKVQSNSGKFTTKYMSNYYFLFGENFRNARKTPARYLRKFHRPTSIEVGTETTERYHIVDSSVSEYVVKPLMKRIDSTRSNNFKSEYSERNSVGRHLENKRNHEELNTSFNSILLTSVTHPSSSTQPRDDRLDEKALKTHKTLSSSAQHFPVSPFKYKSHFQVNRSGEVISGIPLTFLSQPAFAELLPIPYEGHLAESTRVSILGVTSIISIGLLCFVIGLLVYRKYDSRDSGLSPDTLKVQGKNVIVKLSDDEPDQKVKNYSKPLTKAPLLTPYLKSMYYKALPHEEDEFPELEWQSELGEWLSDSDVTK